MASLPCRNADVRARRSWVLTERIVVMVLATLGARLHPFVCWTIGEFT